MSVTGQLRTTPLHAAHVAAGAKLVPFAGWEMPIQYTGIREEHRAVRRHAGMFDVSHMGQVQTRGPGAEALLQRLTSNDVRRIPVGGAQYGLLCNEAGGVVDDLFTYRLGECEYLTVTNAANHGRDLAWMREHASGFDADVLDAADRFAMVAVQGPEARRIVADLADGELPPPAPATRARTASSSCWHPATPRPSGTRCWRRASPPAAWERATRSAWRRATTFTGTTSARIAIRSAPVSAGPAPRRRGSSEPIALRRFEPPGPPSDSSRS